MGTWVWQDRELGVPQGQPGAARAVMTEPNRHRLAAGCLGALTIAAGLGVRAVSDGAVSNLVGVALWDTLVCCLIVLLRPDVSPRSLFVAGALLGIGTEVLQATGLPLRLYRAHPLFALVLGTTFQWADVPAYPVGAALGAAGQALWPRGPRPREPSGS
jgi:hypothetical protein